MASAESNTKRSSGSLFRKKARISPAPERVYFCGSISGMRSLLPEQAAVSICHRSPAGARHEDGSPDRIRITWSAVPSASAERHTSICPEAEETGSKESIKRPVRMGQTSRFSISLNPVYYNPNEDQLEGRMKGAGCI